MPRHGAGVPGSRSRHSIRRIARTDRKGGDQLLPVFLSKVEIEKDGEAIDKHRAAIVKETFLPRIQGFPEVRALFERLRADGIVIALAWSAKGEELQTYKQA